MGAIRNSLAVYGGVSPMTAMEPTETQRVPRARRISLLRALRRSFSWKSSTSSLLVSLCVAYISYCHCLHNAYSPQAAFHFSHGPCAQGYNLLPVLIGVILYAVYLAECWQSRNKLDLLKAMGEEEADSYLSSLRDSTPQVWWKAVSYHYARRTRQVTRYRNGEAMAANQVYYERVDTESGEETFLYDGCGVRDISGAALDLKSFPVVRVYVSRGFAFATSNSASLGALTKFVCPTAEEVPDMMKTVAFVSMEFEEQRSRFFDEYESRDDYLEVREGMHLSSPVHHLLCLRKGRPWYLWPAVFWLFSLLLLTWPVRAIAEWRTAYMHYRVIKLFGTNYLSPSSANYTGPLSRCSSMESVALAAAVLSRPLLLPSYSMALLSPPLPSLQLAPPPAHRSYGGMDGAPPPPLLPPPPRSTSFNTALSSAASSIGRPARSRSFGWSSPWGRIEEEGERLLPSESPPPYEVALRLCAPLYDRLRQSLARLSPSLHSLPKTLPH